MFSNDLVINQSKDKLAALKEQLSTIDSSYLSFIQQNKTTDDKLYQQKQVLLQLKHHLDSLYTAIEKLLNSPRYYDFSYLVLYQKFQMGIQLFLLKTSV